MLYSLIQNPIGPIVIAVSEAPATSFCNFNIEAALAVASAASALIFLSSTFLDFSCSTAFLARTTSSASASSFFCALASFSSGENSV
jgi:hypothetical protein